MAKIKLENGKIIECQSVVGVYYDNGEIETFTDINQTKSFIKIQNIIERIEKARNKY